MTKFRYTIFVVTVFLTLALSAMITVPALADDTVPPPTETPALEIPPTDPAPEVASPVMDDNILQEQTVTELLASVPEGTDIVVVNEAGESVPMATREAADVIVSGDPQWCPAGVTPGGAGCTASTSSFEQMLTNLTTQYGLTGPKKAGVIWIESSYNSSVNDPAPTGFTLDGFALSSMNDYALTINGGWTGSGNTLDPNNLSEFNVPIVITSWAGLVTINNLLITNAGGPDYALHADSWNSVTLNNVHVQENTTAKGGLDISVSHGSIVINNSSFIGNTGTYGLFIDSPVVIKLNNINVNENNENGAYIWNSNGGSNIGVTVNNSNFNSNGKDGLYIMTKGIILLNNVNAMDNDRSGAYLNNCFIYDPSQGLCTWQSPSSTVTIKGSNNFSNNGWDGLRVFSSGAITVNNLTANNNGADPARPGVSYPNPQDYDAYGKGVFLHNYGAFGPKPITLTGTNTFNGNASSGLFALSYGAITVNNLTAGKNGCDIIKDTDPQFCAGAYLDGSGINLTGYNFFEDNARDGLIAYSYNTVINLSNLYAQGNGENGVLAETYGSKASNINILGTNTFLDNTNAGLLVFSNGIITTNNITALSNTGDGAYLNNCVNSGSACTSSPKAVTMNGNNNINFNLGDGLYIESGGTIKVNNLTASNNAGWGAVLDNNWTNAIGTVTITGFANTTNNGKRGLSIYSRGAVTTSNLTANANGPISAAADELFYDGVYINNATDPTKLMNVTLLGVNQFNDNWNSGLQISSYGIVVLNNITANNNGEPFDAVNNPTPEGDGVRVNNSTSSLPKSVTLNGINYFNGNLNDGLEILSTGAIIVNKVMANENGGYGAWLNNQFGTVNSVITLIGYGIFNGNGSDGLYALSHGTITASNVTANFNLGNGAYLANDSATSAAVTISLLGVNFFNGNNQSGLMVYSDGQITANNITANDNVNGYGAYLDNVTNGSLLAPKAITLAGSNMFVHNFLDGLYFSATGNVTLTRITADLNDGALINAYSGAGVKGVTAGTITLTCGSMTNNTDGSGYDLTAGIGKLITLKGVFTYGNGLVDVSSSPTVSTRTCPLP